MATVITNANSDTPAVDGIFNGISFFILQSVPSRKHFSEQITANGGRVVKLEAQADHIIADHMRKGPPPGSLSYKFIEASLKAQEVVDPKNHAAGPPIGAIRDVGSNVPGRSTRTPFTPEDDLDLWNWLQKRISEGAMPKGNDVYKQMEARNPRHPFQAWRDRYIKKLMQNPPAGASGANGTVPENITTRTKFTAEDDRELWEWVEDCRARGEALKGNGIFKELEEKNPRHTFHSWRDRYLQRGQNGPPPWEGTEADENASNGTASKSNRKPKKKQKIIPAFNEDDFNLVWDNIEDILKIDEDSWNDAWDSWTSNHPNHTAQQWKALYENEVFPAYQLDQKRKEIQQQNGYSKKTSASSSKRKRDDTPEEVEEAVVQKRRKIENGNSNNHAREPSPQLPGSNADSSEASSSGEGNVVQEGAVETADGAHPNQLTEANLASQQAEHNGQLLRGTDIPEDDEMQDQTDYIKYLQSATGANQPMDGAADAPNPKSTDMFADKENVQLPAEILTEDEELPGLPTEQDLDLAWPSSPEQPTNQALPESEIIPFETHATYPALQSGVEVMDDDKFLSSQPFQSQGVEFSHGQPSKPIPYEMESELNGEELPQAQNGSQNSQESAYDEDLDLTVAEPDGGFSSSPAKTGSQAQGKKATKGANTMEAINEEDEEQMDDKAADDAASQDSDFESSLPQPPNKKARLQKSVETQDILDAETQQVDLSMPLPPSTQEEEEDDSQDLPFDPFELAAAKKAKAKSASQHPKQADITNDDTPDEEDLESFIDKMKSKYGADDDALLEALHCTSGRLDLTDLVLLYQKVKQDLPEDVRVRGVWSEEDDVTLESGNARDLKDLSNTFTWPACLARMQFLAESRDS